MWVSSDRFIHALCMVDAGFIMRLFGSGVFCSFVCDSDSRNIGVIVVDQKIYLLCAWSLVPRMKA